MVACSCVVIGMGNPEMGDDGVGVFLVDKLREQMQSGAWRPSAPDVELVSACSDPILAGAWLMEASSALLVDAADIKASPGDVRAFWSDEARFTGSGTAGSTHTLPLAEVLRMVGELGASPRLRLMAVQPGELFPGEGLSPRLLERVPEMLSRIKEEVSKLP